MAILRVRTLLVVLFSVKSIVAFPSFSEEVVKSHNGEITLTVEHLKIGYNEYWLNENQKRHLIWKSFWGTGTAIFLQDDHYLALLDSERFNVLGPVLIFILENDHSIQLIYQSPANSQIDENRFGYGLDDFTSSGLKVRVFKNNFRANSSRAVEGAGFTYSVEFDTLHPINLAVYPIDDIRYFNVNSQETTSTACNQ